MMKSKVKEFTSENLICNQQERVPITTIDKFVQLEAFDKVLQIPV